MFSFGKRRRKRSEVEGDDMRYLRLKKSKDIIKILKTGSRAYSKTLTLVYLPSDKVEMAVCVGKKFGKSVQRNRIKRLLRAAFSEHAGNILKPAAFLLLPKQSEKYSFSLFARDIGKILAREKLLEG